MGIQGQSNCIYYTRITFMFFYMPRGEWWTLNQISFLSSGEIRHIYQSQIPLCLCVRRDHLPPVFGTIDHCPSSGVCLIRESTPSATNRLSMTMKISDFKMTFIHALNTLPCSIGCVIKWRHLFQTLIEPWTLKLKRIHTPRDISVLTYAGLCFPGMTDVSSICGPRHLETKTAADVGACQVCAGSGQGLFRSQLDLGKEL